MQAKTVELIDTHCHLVFDEFAGALEGVLLRSRAAGVTGWIAVGTEPAVSEKLEYLIVHPEIWPEMGRCGREFVEKNYNIRRLNRRLVEIYQQLVSGQ